MFSEIDEHSLRVVVSLAEHAQTAIEIEEKTKIPKQQLSGIIDLLINSKVLSQTDNNTQFKLTNDAEHLSIYDILNSIHPWQRWSQCPIDVEDHSNELCPLHRRLENVSSLVERQLRATSIKSLISNPDDLRPLCNKLAN